jgi:hypothetical protein
VDDAVATGTMIRRGRCFYLMLLRGDNAFICVAVAWTMLLFDVVAAGTMLLFDPFSLFLLMISFLILILHW